MSDYTDKPGTGAIFKNNKLKETHPDYRGSIVTPGGERLELSLWLRTSKAGTKYFSVAVQKPYKKDEAAPQPQDEPQYASAPADDDEMPF